jgi:outer membrane protein assembly factor BamD (BamD/ComL family)
VIGPTYLLELQIEEYKKLKEELIRYGLKHSFQEMEAIIKRNYIIKNWMRNKRRTEPRK